MTNKLTLSTLTLLLSLPLALHAQNQHNHYRSHSHHAVPYKGDTYKGAWTEVEVPPPPESIPCKTYTFDSGFYLGVNPGLVTTYTTAGTSAYKGFQASFFAGYDYVISNFYFAAEFFAQRDAELQNYPNVRNNNGNVVGVRSTYGGGFSLIPGLIIADTIMGYLRVGSVTTHFQDTAQTKTGGQVGAGLQVAVSESWNIRCEYDYSFYPSLTNVGAPRSDDYRIGVIYKL